MGTTSPDNIYYAEVGTTANDAAISAAEATSVQEALDVRQFRSYKWANAAARGLQTGMAEGDLGDQANTNITYRYNGTAWLPLGGLIPIVPTSVAGTGVTVTAGGKVMWTAGNNRLRVNGVFTTEFDAYKVVWSGIPVAGVEIELQWSASNVDITTAAYHRSFVQVNPTGTVSGLGVGSQGSLFVGRMGGGYADGSFDVFSPQLARPTRLIAQSSDSEQYGRQLYGMLANNTLVDGFALFPGSASTWGGWLRVYGYNNN